jgi:hypothetical protein
MGSGIIAATPKHHGVLLPPQPLFIFPVFFSFSFVSLEKGKKKNRGIILENEASSSSF